MDDNEIKIFKIDKLLEKSIERDSPEEKNIVAKRAEYMSGFSLDREKIEFFK